MARWKILLFRLLFASLVLNCSTSGHRAKRAGEKWINENFIKVLDKIESMEKKMEQLESKGNETFDTRQIVTNITRLIIHSNDNTGKKIEKFEGSFRNIEENCKKIEKFEENFKNIEVKLKKIEKIEEKLNKIENIEGNVTNINEKLGKIEMFGENFKNIEGNLKKSEKCEAKLNGMELILLEMKNASDQSKKKSESDDVRGGVTSPCTCADKSTATPVKANVQPTDNRNASVKNEQKALNACHPNPCLHGGRCRLSSTGSDYNCECPKFSSGIHCQNMDCSVEKKCHRFKDTLYVVIETKITWAEAKVKCEGLNMTLAMPKDEERTQFLWNQLRPIYTTHPVNRLWIGLKRDEGMSKGQWEWVDGSALGEYVGYQGMKSATSLLFGALYVGGNESYMWDWYYPSNQFYSICETHISTN